MKKVIILSVLFFASVVFASDYQKDAEAKFNKLSAIEALSAGFEKQVYNIGMPGTSSFYSPLYELCVNGNTVQTKTAKKSCILWQGKKDGEVKTFNRKMDAEKYANSVTCAGFSAPMIVSSPINYTQEQCVLWQGKKDGEVKTFNRKMDADKYSNNSVCVQTAVVSKTIPTVFTVNFYRNKIESNRYLGSHKYSLPACMNVELEPVPAH